MLALFCIGRIKYNGGRRTLHPTGVRDILNLCLCPAFPTFYHVECSVTFQEGERSFPADALG